MKTLLTAAAAFAACRTQGLLFHIFVGIKLSDDVVLVLKVGVQELLYGVA